MNHSLRGTQKEQEVSGHDFEAVEPLQRGLYQSTTSLLPQRRKNEAGLSPEIQPETF
jgi:hypothetical protein